MRKIESCPCCDRDMIRADDLFAQSTLYLCTLPGCMQELTIAGNVKHYRTLPYEEYAS